MDDNAQRRRWPAIGFGSGLSRTSRDSATGVLRISLALRAHFVAGVLVIEAMSGAFSNAAALSFWLESSRFNQSEISNSRLSLSIMTNRAELHWSRSDFPNLTPLTAQFASSDDFRAIRSTRIPTKGSQVGLDLFTAAVIAASRVARLIGSRVVGSRESDVWLTSNAVIFLSQ